MFPLKIGNDVKIVRKIDMGEFSNTHREVISQAEYKDGQLSFPHSGWSASFLGAGEEKAVFVISDNDNRIFALEVIDQRTYLNGRFVGGCYFFETIVSNLQNIKYHPKAVVGLTFTGLVKAREYVHGYEWARFQYSPNKQSAFDTILTSWLRTFFTFQFNTYRSQYKDVHDRNIMFEIRGNTEKGVPITIKNWLGKTMLVKVGIQPIDVR